MRPPANEAVPLTDQAIRAALRLEARLGYRTDAEIVDSVLEQLTDEHGEQPGLRERIESLAPKVLEAQAAVERTWPVPTDCDRLDRAFAKLERAGIVARQNFTCCQTCGHAEIGDELDGAACDGPVRGYTFFHAQDTEAAEAGAGIYLAFGAVLPPGSAAEALAGAAAEVAREIVRALRAEGLEVDWDGDPARRIGVPLQWRRRRHRR